MFQSHAYSSHGPSLDTYTMMNGVMCHAMVKEVKDLNKEVKSQHSIHTNKLFIKKIFTILYKTHM